MTSRAEMLEAIRLHAELERRKSGRKLTTFYPDEGPLRRELYPKHLEFFLAGAHKRERLFLAANRIGKTEGAGGYELTCHLTGQYPTWWQGRRFARSNNWWAAGDTRETVRDILQRKLLGKQGDPGTGLIPREAIVKTSPGFIPDAVQAIWVKHASGGMSVVQFKSYDQGREAFQGTEQDGIWLDEEPPEYVYTECLLRTMTNDGLVMLTFTPLRGMSDVVLAFLPGGAIPEKQDGAKAVISASWDDVPHLSEQAKTELLASIPPFQRDARSKGLPQLGAGLIYPVPESTIVCAPFQIPKHWPRSYGLDVGWKKTAAIWGAHDTETDTVYWYSEHYQGEVEPSVHAAAISRRGNLPGAIDPASRGRSQVDGRNLMQQYRELGLDLVEAVNAVEAGLFALWERFSTGRLKIFSNLQNTLKELRLYRRDERGKVVKENDHACLAPGTLVDTRQGQRRIETLIGTEGEVLTAGGAWASYRCARLTRTGATVVRLTFDDGRAVICTPDHRFLTPGGWERAAELVGLLVYDAVSQRIEVTRWTRSSFLQPVRSFKAAASTCVAFISSVMASACTALSGALRTVESQRAPTSTIATATASTIPWPTSSWSWPASTPVGTDTPDRRAFHRSLARLLPNGTGAPRVGLGTSDTTRSIGRSSISPGSSSASSAGSISLLPRTLARASVPTPARRGGASSLASTTRNAVASSAAHLLWRIATRRNAHARGGALRRCLSVTAAGQSDVFCLEVPGAHAFAVAGGLVAHNCDAGRYQAMSLDIARAPAPLEPKPEEPFVMNLRGDGAWMG